MRRAGTVSFLVAAFALAGGTTYAADRPAGALQVALPPPLVGLTPVPPLTSPMATVPNQYAGRISASTYVDAKLARDGTPFAVEATQRLGLHGMGDYYLVVPAPIRDVFPARGTESDPGGRANAVLWQGFSAGRRVLVARLVLETQPAAAALPLRIRISKRRGEVVVDLRNATGTRVQSFSGNPDRRDTQRFLAGLRRYAAGRGQPPNPYVGVAELRGRARQTVARLRVTGQLRIEGSPRSTVRFARTLGTKPIRIRAETSGNGRPALQVRAVPLYPRIATGRGLRGRALLDVAVESALAVSRARQYHEFIVNPSPVGPSRTAYVFRTAMPPRAVRAAPLRDHEDSPLVPILAVLGATLGLGAAVVIWAHL